MKNICVSFPQGQFDGWTEKENEYTFQGQIILAVYCSWSRIRVRISENECDITIIILWWEEAVLWLVQQIIKCNWHCSERNGLLCFKLESCCLQHCLSISMYLDSSHYCLMIHYMVINLPTCLSGYRIFIFGQV